MFETNEHNNIKSYSILNNRREINKSISEIIIPTYKKYNLIIEFHNFENIFHV